MSSINNDPPLGRKPRAEIEPISTESPYPHVEFDRVMKQGRNAIVAFKAGLKSPSKLDDYGTFTDLRKNFERLKKSPHVRGASEEQREQFLNLKSTMQDLISRHHDNVHRAMSIYKLSNEDKASTSRILENGPRKIPTIFRPPHFKMGK